MTCWCSGILCGWCETVIALTGRLGLASHTAVTGARWTIRGFSSIVLIVSVSPLCLVPFLIIYMEIAEPEPYVDIHNSGRYTQFGQRSCFAFFLTLYLNLQCSGIQLLKQSRNTVKLHSRLKPAAFRRRTWRQSGLCSLWQIGQYWMVLWRFVACFPKRYLVAVRSHISALHKATRCDFSRPEDAVQQAPVLPCFVDCCFEPLEKIKISRMAGRYSCCDTCTTHARQHACACVHVSHVPLA